MLISFRQINNKSYFSWSAIYNTFTICTLLILLTDYFNSSFKLVYSDQSSVQNEINKTNQLLINQLIAAVNLQANKTTNAFENQHMLIPKPLSSNRNPTISTTTQRRQADNNSAIDSQNTLNFSKPPIQSQRLTQSNQNSSLAFVRQKWRQMERSISESMLLAGQQLKSTFEELNGRNLLVSNSCKLALNELIEGFQQQKLWASQTLDATARLPSGLLEGTLTELGNFDQCLAIKYDNDDSINNKLANNNNHKQIATSSSGQYCSVQIKPALTHRPRLHTICQRTSALSSSASLSNNQTTNNKLIYRLFSQNSHQFHYVGLRLGLCTPSRCSKSDLQHLLTSYLTKYELLGQVKSCQVSDERTNELRLDFSQQCIASTFVLLIILIALGTLFDLKSSSRKIATAAATGERDLRLGQNASLTENVDRETMESVRLGSISGHNNEKNSSQQQRGNCRAQAKRWHYQVYNSDTQDCCPHSIPAPGLQRNPLVALESSSQQPNRLLAQKGNQLMFSQQPETNNANGRKLLQAAAAADDDGDEAEYEEAWISQLEENQFKLVSNDGDDQKRSRKRSNKTRSSRAKGKGSKSKKVDNGKSDVRSIFFSVITCFSLKKNLSSIGRHSKSVGNNEMNDVKVIHGLRTITMIWIIFGHTIGLVSPEMMNNLFALAQLSCASRLLQALLNATLAVNTFFMISGLVTVLSFARRCKSAQQMIFGADKLPLGKKVTALSGVNYCGYDKNHETTVFKNCLLNLDNDKTNQKKQSNRKRRYDDEHIINPEVCSIDSSLISTSLSSSDSSNAKYVGATRSTLNFNGPIGTRRQRGDRATRLQSNNESRFNYWLPADFKPFLWILMRYLRLTPAYATIIGISILLPSLSSGPFWFESIGQMGPICKRNWWLNLTYLNNFIETDKLCLIHSWYLSNDWQFFILTLIIFAIFYKSKKVAILLIIILIISTSAITFVSTVENEFPPTIVTTSPAVAERWLFIHSLYYKPWPHLPSYLIGLIAGYLILIKDSLRLSQGWQIFGSLLSLLISVSVLNSIYPWNMGLQVEPLLTGLHSATFRTLWAACCAWLIFALSIRPRNPLARLLSWHGFQVSSRLTYCAYLVHPLIIYYHFGTLRERMDSSIYGQFHRFMATLALSYLFALLLSLFIESPSIQLQHLFSNLNNKVLISVGDNNETNRNNIKKSKQHSSDTNIDDNNRNSWSQLTSSYEGQSTSVTSLAGTASSESFKILISDQEPNPRSIFKKSNNSLPNLSNSEDSSNCHQQQIDNPEQQQKRRSSSHSNESAIALADADFQRKLAQAIGRGFRIRSRIANGTIKQQQVGGVSRRATQIKRLPKLTLPETASMFIYPEQAINSSLNFINNHRELEDRELKLQQQSKELIEQQHQPTKRGEFSTFVANNTSKQTSDSRGRRLSHDLSKSGQQQQNNNNSPSKRASIQEPQSNRGICQNPANLNQMILMKHKLMSRSQSQIDV